MSGLSVRSASSSAVRNPSGNVLDRLGKGLNTARQAVSNSSGLGKSGEYTSAIKDAPPPRYGSARVRKEDVNLSSGTESSAPARKASSGAVTEKKKGWFVK